MSLNYENWRVQFHCETRLFKWYPESLRMEWVPHVVTKEGCGWRAAARQWGQRDIPRRPDLSPQLWEKSVEWGVGCTEWGAQSGVHRVGGTSASVTWDLTSGLWAGWSICSSAPWSPGSSSSCWCGFPPAGRLHTGHWWTSLWAASWQRKQEWDDDFVWTHSPNLLTVIVRLLTKHFLFYVT